MFKRRNNKEDEFSSVSYNSDELEVEDGDYFTNGEDEEVVYRSRREYRRSKEPVEEAKPYHVGWNSFLNKGIITLVVILIIIVLVMFLF